MSVRTTQTEPTTAGTWRLIARPPGAAPMDITFVRGVPTMIGSYSLTDPFGPQQASLTFPKITIFDAIGAGDLEWLREGCDVDLVFNGSLPAGYPDGAFSWEGYMESFDFSADGLSVALKGAMLQLDNYLAKPSYPSRPIPYEYALTRLWDKRPDLRLRPLEVEWPTWWDTIYSPVRGTNLAFVPTNVVPGDQWTGLVTRDTGAWQPALTNYVQTLLTSMYTKRGRWTIDLLPDRRPVLRHRDFKTDVDSSTLVIDPATPGVSVALNIDYSQSLNVVYGQGRALSGEAFSGMSVSADGQRTVYRPLAHLRTTEPVSDRNGWLNPAKMRREMLLQLQQGLDQQEAQKVAQAHLQHFSDPGLTGTITLTSDPTLGGAFLPRVLIKAGMSVQLKSAFGRPEGVLLHITQATHDLQAGSSTLTVDAKYRDRLTVEEVRVRGRDSLSVQRMLIAGQYSPPLPDQLFPWNYAEGSGFIPSGPKFNSRPLFADMPDEITFPWTDWTTQRPPRSKAWRQCYIRIGPKSTKADDNWARATNATGNAFAAIPIRMAAAGQIRLIQLAAYDVNGNVLKVPFHFSIYSLSGVNVLSMPKISTTAQATETGYAINQHYPFFAEAWETYRLNGTQRNTEEPVQVSSVGLIRAWGTKYVPAGYWPGTKPTGDPPTGLLVDEGVFDFNLVGGSGPTAINPYDPRRNGVDAGNVYLMLYCDAQLDQEVFFAGRMFRVEPGQQV